MVGAEDDQIRNTTFLRCSRLAIAARKDVNSRAITMIASLITIGL